MAYFSKNSVVWMWLFTILYTSSLLQAQNEGSVMLPSSSTPAPKLSRPPGQGQSSLPKTVCGSQFTDIPSKVYLADIVFQGTVLRLEPSRIRDPKVTVSTNDAIFKIDSVAKGDGLLKAAHKEVIRVGVFRDEARAGQCVGSVLVNETYYVYVRLDKQGRAHSYRITALPDLDTKVARLLVKNSACDTCVRAPRVTSIQPGGNVSVVGGRGRLKVECEAVGQPQPVLTWLHNSTPLTRSDTVSIRTTRKGSRLTIKKVFAQHAGTYTCVATNVVGTSYGHVDVTVTEATTTPPPPASSVSPECFGHYCMCPEQTYCLNGGTCFHMLSIKTQFCRCASDYHGVRCQEKISAGFDLARLAKTGTDDVRWAPDAEIDLKLPPEFLRWLEVRSRVAIQD